jgi:hypothetical protein
MPWSLHDSHAVAAVIFALLGNGWLWFLHRSGNLTPRYLSMSMTLYAASVFFVLFI